MKSRIPRWICFGLVAVATAANAQSYHITDLGTLGGSSSTSNALGINNLGQVTGQSDTALGVAHAFVTNFRGQMIDLNPLDANFHTGYGINDLGQVTGYFYPVSGGPPRAYITDGSGRMIDLGALPGMSNSIGSAISNHGQVAGYAYADHSSQIDATRWLGTAATDLNTLGVTLTIAFGINDAGQAVGYSGNSIGDQHATLWNGTTGTDLGTLGGSRSYALGINNVGQVVGWADIAGDGQHATLWNGTTAIDLGTLVGFSVANAINDSGQVVGDSGNLTFVTVNGVMTDLQSLLDSSGSGWKLNDAKAINARGQIAGTGINPQGQQHAFLLTPLSLTPITLSLIDPVPIFVSGGGITASPSDLAAALQSVNGVAADGATQVVVRVSGANAGDGITLALLDENGNPTTDSCGEGYLGALPGGGSCAGVTGGPITVTANSSGSGSATAFAVYHAPQDFVRAGKTDPEIRTRTVSIQAVDHGSTTTRVITIVRPPVVLVHGLWESDSDWLGSNRNNGVYAALQSTGNFAISFGHYDFQIALKASVPSYSLTNNVLPLLVSGNSLGFSYGATQVLPQIRQAILSYKEANQVAGVQADIVAHSMGGDASRTLPQINGYLDQYNYGLGVVHKLITIDTPHQGSPLATALLQSNNLCVRSLFAFDGHYAFTSVTPLVGAGLINGGVGDLQPTSSAVGAIHTGSATIPTAMIGAQLSSGELAGVGGPFSLGYVLTLFCGVPNVVINAPSDPLAIALNPTGWPALFVSPTNPAGASDGIVPLSSAFDNEASYVLRLPFVIPIPNAVHSSGTEDLGFGQPSEFDQASGVPTDVLQLLNTPVSNSVFEAKP